MDNCERVLIQRVLHFNIYLCALHLPHFNSLQKLASRNKLAILTQLVGRHIAGVGDYALPNLLRVGTDLALWKQKAVGASVAQLGDHDIRHANAHLNVVAEIPCPRQLSNTKEKR